MQISVPHRSATPRPRMLCWPSCPVASLVKGRLPSRSVFMPLRVCLAERPQDLMDSPWNSLLLFGRPLALTWFTFLTSVLSSITGPDQMCGVPGRTISSNFFLIRDLLEYVDREDIPLALLSLDQEKAFDWVDWGFLLRTLETFNFGPTFLRWIKLFYTNIESAVVINSWTSSFFQPSQGVHQGCPLSPLLM